MRPELGLRGLSWADNGIRNAEKLYPLANHSDYLQMPRNGRNLMGIYFSFFLFLPFFLFFPLSFLSSLPPAYSPSLPSIPFLLIYFLQLCTFFVVVFLKSHLSPSMAVFPSARSHLCISLLIPQGAAFL